MDEEQFEPAEFAQAFQQFLQSFARLIPPGNEPVVVLLMAGVDYRR